jgi:4-hydroxy-2-oxoheptanedioate aldolase
MDLKLVRQFRKRVKSQPVFGPFCKTCDPAVIETLGHAGFDFVILDMEHGPNSVETLQHLVRAAELAGVLPIVRTAPGNLEQIGKVLDIGAAGVQVPQIGTAAEVEAALRAARFSPMGERGVCRFVRAARYSSMEKTEYFRRANEALVVVQIEGRQGLDNLDAILAIKGIDVIFIGPYDLSQSLGVPGQVDHPLVIAKTQQILKACLAKGIAVGNFTEKPKQTAFWIEQGLRYMSFSVDMGILYEAGQTLLKDLRGEKG